MSRTRLDESEIARLSLFLTFAPALVYAARVKDEKACSFAAQAIVLSHHPPCKSPVMRLSSHNSSVHFEISRTNLKAKIGPSCFSSFCFQIFEEEGKENLCDHHRSFHHTCLLVRALGTMRAATFQGILVRAVALVAFAALSVSAFHTVSTSSVSAPWAVLRAFPHAARSGAVPPINVSARSRIAAASNTPVKVPYRQLEMMRSLPPSCPPINSLEDSCRLHC
jgi:hypothetical protein